MNSSVLVDPQLGDFGRTAAVEGIRRVRRIRLVMVVVVVVTDVGTFLSSGETLLGSFSGLVQYGPGPFFVHRPIKGLKDR